MSSLVLPIRHIVERYPRLDEGGTRIGSVGQAPAQDCDARRFPPSEKLTSLVKRSLYGVATSDHVCLRAVEHRERREPGD